MPRRRTNPRGRAIAVRRTPKGVAVKIGTLYAYPNHREGLALYVSSKDVGVKSAWITRYELHEQLDRVMDAMTAKIEEA